MIVVPDASVILKWIISQGETHTAQALNILNRSGTGSIILRVPTLWIYEVGNILTRKLEPIARQTMEELVRLEMDEVQIKANYLQRVIDITKRFPVTFYDASYHAIAIEEDGVFVTADEKYFQKAHPLGHIEMLSHWDGTLSADPSVN